MKDPAYEPWIGHLRKLIPSAEIDVSQADAPEDRGATLSIRWGKPHAFTVLRRASVHTGIVARVAAEVAGSAAILFADYVQPAAADALRARGIGYMDRAGNCHIVASPLLVHVEGRRAARPKTTTFKAFSGDGLRVIFVLLLKPEWASRPYRELADVAGVSHGVVQYTMNDLIELGYVLRKARTDRQLLMWDELLDRWATFYAEVLRPKLYVGTYRLAAGQHLSDWKSLPLDAELDWWGGEPAASLIGGDLRPGHFTLYSRSARSELMKRLRLLPDDRGEIEVYSAFWTKEVERTEAFRARETRPNAVPRLIAYADLFHSDDPRNADTAMQLGQRLSGDHQSSIRTSRSSAQPDT